MGKSTQTKIGYLIRDGEETREIIWIKDENRERGSYVLGLSGTGKSSFYQTIILQDILKEYPTIVIDPHGDLVNHLIAQLPNDENILKRVYLLDLTDEEYPFALNVFTCENPADNKQRTRTRNRVLKVFEKLWPEVASSVLFDKLMPNVVETLIDNQGMTLRDIRRLLHDAEYRKSKIRNLHNGEVWDFWQYEYKEKETEVLDNRLRKFLIDPVIRHITCHPDGTINLRRAIEEKQIILVKLPTNVPEYQISAPIIGTMLLSLIVGATFSFDDTAKQERPGYSLFVDEVENFVTDDFDIIFNQARKYRPRLLIANQHLYQLPQTMQKAATGADSVFSFKIDKDDARAMASIFYDENMAPKPDPIYRDVIKHLPNYQSKNAYHYLVVKKFYEQYIKGLQEGYKQEPQDFQIARYNFGLGEISSFELGNVEHIRWEIKRTLENIERFLYEAETKGNVQDNYWLRFIRSGAGRILQFDSYHTLLDKCPEGVDPIENALNLRRDKQAKEQQELDAPRIQLEQKIHTLESFLVGDAFYLYLNEYYTHFYTEQQKSLSYELITEAQVHDDVSFWEKVVASIQREKNITPLINSAKKFLQNHASAYTKLTPRSSVDKIIQQEINRKDINKLKREEDWFARYSVERVYEDKSVNYMQRKNRALGMIQAIYFIKYSTNESTYSSSRKEYYSRQSSLHADPYSGVGLGWSRRYEEVVEEGGFFSSTKIYLLPITMNNLPLVLRGLVYGGEAYTKVKELWEKAVEICQELENFAREYPDKETFVQKNQSLYQKFLAEGIEREFDRVRKEIRENASIQKEVQRNAVLCKLDTPEKVLEARKAEVKNYIAVLEKNLELLLKKREEKIASDEGWLAADRESLKESKEYYDTFFGDLFKAANALVAHPIGDEKPYRESDVARVLTDLPQRQAFIKVSGEKDGDPPRKLQMKTLDAPQAIVRGQALENRIQRIRDQTRAKYCRPVAEVEAALRGERTGDPQNKENAHQPSTAELPEEERPTRRKRLTSEDETV